jgi:hypothetical protein
MLVETPLATSRAVIGAYRELLAGDASTLVALLHPDVQWLERTASRTPARIEGRAAVAALIESRAKQGAVTAFHALAIRGDSLVMSFRQPWW